MHIKLSLFLGLIFSLTLIVIPAHMHAQSKYDDQFEKAWKEYSVARFPKVIALCEALLQNKACPKAIQLKTYRLLCLSYMEERKSKKASHTMEKMLARYPTYQLGKKEPASYETLYESYNIVPRWKLGLIGGANIALVDTIRRYDLGESGTYDPLPAPQFGVLTEFHITRNWGVSVSLQMQAIQYSYKNAPFDFTDVHFKEKSRLFRVPVSFKYDVGKRNGYPYARLGGAVSWLQKAKADVSRVFPKTDIQAILSEDIDLTTKRTRLHLSSFVGLGYARRFGHSTFFIEGQLQPGFQRWTKRDLRYNHQELQYQFFFIDDDFRIHTLSLEIGITWNLYHIFRN